MKSVICPVTAKFFEEDGPNQHFTAVLFRRCVYVAGPRHMDAINLAFKGMTDLQVRYVSDRIADGKEKNVVWTCVGRWV